jgi:DNA-binding MurR/RpiR family transcriptional regulator
MNKPARSGGTRSLIGRLSDALPHLPRAEHRLGQFLLEFPGELASYNASELAAFARVSNATVTRLIRRLGYDSYEDARRAVRGQTRSGAALLRARPGQAGEGRLAAQVEAMRANIDTTLGRIDEATLAAMASAILAAPRVAVLGFRAAQGLAAYLRWQILQVVPGALLLPGPGETLAENLATLGQGDMLIGFGLRRRVPALATAFTRARAAGAMTILITDHPDDRARQADWLLRCETASPGPLFNHASVMAVCGLLATAVLTGAGPEGRRRLAAIEDAHEALRELDEG